MISRGCRRLRAFLRRHLRWLLAADLLLALALAGYQAYLFFDEPEAMARHAEQVERIETHTRGQPGLRLAVVGNVNSSLRVFGDQIVPRLNARDYDLVVSAGNAVAGGQPENYRTTIDIFDRLEAPWLLTFGDNEESDFGSARFYERLGPHFYAVTAGPARLLFLDATGHTPPLWQLRWLERELRSRQTAHTLVFIGAPLRAPDIPLPVYSPDGDFHETAFARELRALCAELGVDAVFAAGPPVFHQQRHEGLRQIITGGAGGLIIDREASFHHFVDVAIDPEGMVIEAVDVQVQGTPLLNTLDSVWAAFHTLIYVSFWRFLLVMALLVLLARWLYRRIIEGPDYYPDYDIDPTPWQQRRLRVAMFSNNWFPFVSGVVISIARLMRGLQARGDQVLMVAPAYGRGSGPTPGEAQPTESPDAPNSAHPEHPEQVLRLPALIRLGDEGAFPLPHLFDRAMGKRLRAFRPDVVHVHHPFWLGWAGLAHGRRLGVPVVWTYHTRIEQYAHFVPLPGLLFRNLISHALVRRFANRCDGVIVPTESAEEYLRMVGVRQPILVQPTGIDEQQAARVDPERVAILRRRFGLGEEELVLVSACRLSREKNIEFLLRALAGLKRDRHFRLLLLGDGPEREAYQRLAAELGIARQVLFAGAVPPEEMPAHYCLGDIFVFASRSETQGMVILEAMAAGLPVVTVRSSGIDDVVEEGVNGYKTPHDLHAWRQRLEALMDDADLRQRLAAAARQTAQAHGIARFAGAIHDFYGDLLALRARRQSEAAAHTQQ